MGKNITGREVALVTGVSSGIGRATASLLWDRGFRTFGTVRETSRVGGLPPGLETVRLDVREEESVRSCVRTVVDRAGRIDALVNIAIICFSLVRGNSFSLSSFVGKKSVVRVRVR
jgi:NAD(P)-dependent dehydrogenase (short-subunit alcohol dehydrogenase family)